MWQKMGKMAQPAILTNMSITYIQKDVTTVTRGVVAHGVNCQGKMNSGVAKAIRTKWPKVYERYMTVCNAVDNKSELLGLSHMVNCNEQGNDLFVANCFTQEYYGYDGSPYAKLEAVESSLRYALGFCDGASLPLYMPRIASKLGGLNWDTQIFPLLNRLHEEYTVTQLGREPEIYVCDL
jgi:O-acetyl-ADP-ribose deacetylase (regulator of RNase III)